MLFLKGASQSTVLEMVNQDVLDIYTYEMLFCNKNINKAIEKAKAIATLKQTVVNFVVALFQLFLT